jgi:hypothetical protein
MTPAWPCLVLGQHLITLVTCTPVTLAFTPHRIVVQGTDGQIKAMAAATCRPPTKVRRGRPEVAQRLPSPVPDIRVLR